MKIVAFDDCKTIAKFKTIVEKPMPSIGLSLEKNARWSMRNYPATGAVSGGPAVS
jgi:hypothetical protein